MSSLEIYAEAAVHALKHAGSDMLSIFPFLFLTYLAMEYIEHKTSESAKLKIEKSGNLGPLIGSLLGAFPQCGFSAAASGLYAGRVITAGTLIAVYLSTSDEMLPIFISEKVAPSVIIKILALKVLIGLAAGFILDFAARQRAPRQHIEISGFCERENCRCHEDGIFKSALVHSLKIGLFIFLITVALAFVIAVAGKDTLAGFLTNKPLIGEMIAGLIGLIPNCAASVVITKLYLEGALSFGGMMAGLLSGAGVGLLVLFRSNRDFKKNLQLTFILYAVGVLAGFLIELSGLSV